MSSASTATKRELAEALKRIGKLERVVDAIAAEESSPKRRRLAAASVRGETIDVDIEALRLHDVEMVAPPATVPVGNRSSLAIIETKRELAALRLLKIEPTSETPRFTCDFRGQAEHVETEKKEELVALHRGTPAAAPKAKTERVSLRAKQELEYGARVFCEEEGKQFRSLYHWESHSYVPRNSTNKFLSFHELDFTLNIFTIISAPLGFGSVSQRA